MDEVQRLTRLLIQDWHGREHGAFRAFWDQVETGPTGAPFGYKKALDQLGRHSKVSWGLLHRVVEICVPSTEHEERLELLAGHWLTGRGSPPPGYCGRIIVAGEVVRGVLTSSQDAGDEQSRAALLERERDQAQRELANHRQKITELQDSITSLSAEFEKRTDEVEADRRALIVSVEKITERMQEDVNRQRAEGERIDARIDRLVQENEDLLARQRSLVQERDDAENRASRHLRELGELRAMTESERIRLYETIGVLEDRVSALHRDLDSTWSNSPPPQAEVRQRLATEDPNIWNDGLPPTPPVIR
ncbi:hypothetical protein [Micromonospora sp. NPDC005171]|uniref:hypothetical protein n=1 Tax=Micromonospora sp. NPDC005171 TaxID=3156866 RepID=UPI0033B2EA76